MLNRRDFLRKCAAVGVTGFAAEMKWQEHAAAQGTRLRGRRSNTSGGDGGPEGPNDFFDNVILGTRSADVFKAYSMRPIAGRGSSDPYYASQLTAYKSGSDTTIFTYDPASDTHPEKQTACKIRMPMLAGGPSSGLAADLDDSQTVNISINGVSANNTPIGGVLKIDNEIIGTILSKVDGSPGTVTVSQRGYRGTTPATHLSGAGCTRNINSIPTQLFLPALGFNASGTYIFGWDAYWTLNYKGSGLNTHKCFQLASNGSNTDGQIWLEPKTNFNGQDYNCDPTPGFDSNLHAWSQVIRVYDAGSIGPSYPQVPGSDDINPQAAHFLAPWSEWIRFWVRIRIDADASYDLIDVWMASESQDPVQTVVDFPYLLRAGTGGTNNLQKFWWEFNTSDDFFARNATDDELVAYGRNTYILNSSDMTGLLVKPVRG